MQSKKITLVALFTMLFATISVAQTTIKGRITDQTSGEAVAFANVMLKTDTSANATLITGAVSDMDGRFSLQSKTEGKVLKIHFIGYDAKFIDLSSQRKSGNTIDLGTITLSQNATALKEVSVTALRKRYTMDGEKIVMNVDDGVTATSANAFEMLRKVPGVMIDNNENITLNGKSGILFQFNGRDMRLPAESMKAILKSLPASNVAKIETIGSPSAKYEAEGTAGIINIIMAQAQTEGFSGTASSWNALAENFRTFNNASLQYVNEKWTLSANGGFGLFNNRIESESKQYLWQGTDTTLMQMLPITEHGKYRTGNFTFTADYKIDSNNSAGATFAFSRNSSPIVEGDPSREFLISRYPYNTVDMSYAIDADNLTLSRNFTGGLYYNHKFDTLGSQMSVSLDFTRDISDNQNLSSTRYYMGRFDSLTRTEDLCDSTFNSYSSYSLKFDATKQFTRKIGLEYGLKSRISLVDNDFRRYSGDSLLASMSNNMTYRENVNAAYVNFSHNVTDKFSYRAGLRFEHTGIALEQKATADDTSYHYFDLFPNINLNYNFSSANSLSLSYAYRITRPDYNSLNPFVSQSSQFSYTSGNPDLLPEYSHRVDLNLRLFYMIFIQASYGYNNDEINNITTAYPGSFMATIQKPYNIGYQQFVSLSLSGMLPLGPVEWTFWLRGSYLQAFADSPLLQMNVEQFNFTTWQSLTIKLPWELKLSVNGFYMSGMYQQGMEMDGMMMFSTALTRQFFKKALRVSLGVNNIPAQKMEINSSLNNYRMQSFMMWDKPFVSLHLQYSFGKTANNNSIKRLQSDDMDDRKGEGGGVEQPGGSGMGQ